MTDTTQLTETVDERDAPVGDDIEKMRAAKEKANAEAAARRLEVKALREEPDALKRTQEATETAALAEQGKFKELYETAENRAATLEKQLREQAEGGDSDEREVQRGFHESPNAVAHANVSAQPEDDNPRTLDAKGRLA